MKIKKIDIANAYDHKGYPSNGLFEVNEMVYYVNKEKSICFYIDTIYDFKRNVEDIENEESLITQSFALKMLAVATGKVKDIEL